MLQTLKNAGVKLNANKCSFYVEKVQYLGHVFDSKSRVYPSPNKVEAIINAPIPTNLKMVQSFVGLANFFSRFVPNFSNVMNPFYALMKKGVKFEWSTSQQNSFELIKNLFKQERFLNLFNPNFETMVESDSSGYGIGCCLFQRQNDNYNCTKKKNSMQK